MVTDVLIIGGGLSAMTAAYEIIQCGKLRVDLLKCGGGASPFIHGICLPLGKGDSEELFYRDTVASGYGQGRPSLIRRLCRDSLSMPGFFQALGVDVDRDETGYRLVKSLGSSVPRIASIGNNTGPLLIRALRERLTESPQYHEHSNYRALSLIKRDGRVVGARCRDGSSRAFLTIGARLVILATGGFGRLFPQSTNGRDMGGDGCAMAYRAGAELTDMEFVQFEPSAAVWPEALIGKSVITTMFYEGAVLRGKNGDRFMLRYRPEGEQAAKDILSKCIWDEIRRNGASPHGGVWLDATAVPEEMWRGIYSPYYHRYLSHGIDLRKQAVEIAPAAHTTCGGVLIDENCRTGVPGLIACGEVTGGLHGANRLGGNAGLETLVFGRAAGKTAIEDWENIPAPPEMTDHTECRKWEDRDMAKRLQEVMRSSLGVIRKEEEMKRGLQAVDEMLAQLDGCPDSFVKHRLFNDLTTARIALFSAMARKESVGCHFREDSVAENAPYRVIVKETDGQMTVSKKEV